MRVIMERVCTDCRKKYRRFLIWLLAAGIIGCAVYYIYAVKNLIPDTINLNKNSVERLNFNVPFVGTVEQKETGDDSEAVQAYATNVKAVNVNLLDTLNISTGESGNYNLNFRLLGIINLKNVKLNVCDEVLVIPCGIPVGIYIETKGVDVIGKHEKMLSEKFKENLMNMDNVTIYGNDNSVATKEELINQLNLQVSQGSEHVNIGLYRNGSYIQVRITPVIDKDGKARIGTWVRDDCQGLGTLTYIDKNGRFGALGHGISDIDTGKLVSSGGGRLYCARIWSIVKGKAGIPGEVVGSINYSSEYFLGKIENNTEIGIYGTCHENIYKYIDSYALPVKYKQDVKKGRAYIRSFIDGAVRDYEIYITGADLSNNNVNKGISFTVTDKELLELTGGIIQGMSGSPIIQDGKLIGAVTGVEESAQSKPVAGNAGVYLFDVTSRSAIETVTPESERVRLEANAQAYIIERANQALVDAVEITDNRVKFF